MCVCVCVCARARVCACTVHGVLFFNISFFNLYDADRQKLIDVYADEVSPILFSLLATSLLVNLVYVRYLNAGDWVMTSSCLEC